uniref:Reverse transcriptase domain-containing protein n=1 Tax=Tanacetum cinerariifolium TaxID=118510 RepID=A0A6L2JKY3_TANCI|nr:reverse transcriptase domain-containing protein [Tanacetum cinerariifolium]
MSSSQDSRGYVFHATSPPDTKLRLAQRLQFLSVKNSIPLQQLRNKGDPIRLDFKLEDTEVQDHGIAKGKEVMDEDLRKPFKEAQRTQLTRRIIEFAGPEYKMPTNIKLYDGTTNPEDHMSRFASAANLGEWPMPERCRMFQQILDESARGWFEQLPHDSINEWAYLNEAFIARWTVETGFIMGVPEVMKISSFMDSVKSHELAKRFSNKVPTTVNEVMERLDDFVRSEEACINTELPKGKVSETHRKKSLSFNRRDNRSFRNTHPGESRRNEYRSNYRERNAYPANIIRDDRAPYPLRGENITTGLLQSGNTGRYCDYHQEKFHYTNECIQLRKQLEMALEPGKLNHLVKDVRQRGRGSHGRDAPQPAQVINLISVNSVKDKKPKVREMTETWMNILISFPTISSKDIFEEPLIVKAEVEGYLVRPVYVDKGSSVEVMFEHCFENLDSRIKARLKETRTDLRTFMKFIVVRAPSPYNVGRSGLKTLRAIPSTIQSMMKFPTLKGVATLVTQTVIIIECRRLEKKQIIEEESSEWEKEVAITKEVLINPSFPDQRKRRTFSTEKSGVVTNEVAKWVKAGIVRLVRYPGPLKDGSSTDQLGEVKSCTIIATIYDFGVTDSKVDAADSTGHTTAERNSERTTGYDKVQKNDLWLLSMFDARHQNGYSNVAWVIVKWMKRKRAGTQKESKICGGQFILMLARKCRVLTEDVVRRLSALNYCRDLDTTTFRDLVDSNGKLIPEDPQPGVPRVSIPRPPRASMQDLYNRMGRMEIHQEAIEHMEVKCVAYFLKCGVLFGKQGKSAAALRKNRRFQLTCFNGMADNRSFGLVQSRYRAGSGPYIGAPNLFLLITYSSSSSLSLSAVLKTSNLAARKILHITTVSMFNGISLHCQSFPSLLSWATYKRLVDSTFQHQIGRNLEAYVDDIVTKSKDEKMLLADIAETFDNLKKINMKLNPKKCSFGVEEGKFLGYMVISKGIKANPKNTKALADIQSPRMLKEMQSLSGKLAALICFLAKSVERSLLFFSTMKNITKENKHEYRWTKEAEESFQQIKKLIMDLPSLTLP